jgi:UTP--glucose-1-phosphate uridylyltransferase
MLEKPNPVNAPSNIAIMGRYLLKPSIFTYLKTQERGAGNEYQLTDALREVCKEEGLLGLELKGDRYDIGDKFGYMKAIIEMGLQREELQPQLIEYMQQVLKKQLGKNRSRRAAV